MSVRNTTVDIAKGIGIILVVMGHNPIVFSEERDLYRLIFSFHMPLFYFLAGVYLKDSVPLAKFTAARADALLKPYFVVCIGLGILRLFTAASPWGEYICGMLYATGRTIYWAPLWFLPNLFITLVFCHLLLKLTTRACRKVRCLTLVLLSFFLLGGNSIDAFWDVPLPPSLEGSCLFCGLTRVPGLPFSIDLLPLTSAFTLSGFVSREFVNSKQVHGIPFIGSIICFLVLQRYSTITMDLNARTYGSILPATIQALLGIYITIKLAGLMCHLVIARDCLSYIGKNSLFILMFHTLAQGKAYFWISKISNSVYFNGSFALVAGVGLPLIFLQIVKRDILLSSLLLPRSVNAKRAA